MYLKGFKKILTNIFDEFVCLKKYFAIIDKRRFDSRLSHVLYFHSLL